MQVNSTNRNGNPGIVPPWLQRPDRNPGIVPPWLQGRPVGPTVPVDDDTPRILGAMQPTVYEPTPITPDPEVPRIWGA
jgi:hypothetical protein